MGGSLSYVGSLSLSNTVTLVKQKTDKKRETLYYLDNLQIIILSNQSDFTLYIFFLPLAQHYYLEHTLWYTVVV